MKQIKDDIIKMFQQVSRQTLTVTQHAQLQPSHVDVNIIYYFSCYDKTRYGLAQFELEVQNCNFAVL